MLLDRIQAASLEARKAKNAETAALLTTLYAESARIGKDAGNRPTTDEETIRVVRKFLKGVDQSLALIKHESSIAKALREKATLESFLPQMVSGAALVAAIRELVGKLPEKTPRHMGAVMKSLKELLGSAYDGNEASALVKAELL